MASLFDSPDLLVALVGSSFILPIVFLIWIRNTERWGREPWWALLKSFSWGAVFSVIVAVVVSLIFLGILQEIVPLYVFLAERFANPETIVGVLIVAPLVEEAAKAIGVMAGRRHTEVRTDGLLYGAASGLGFSATENLFYGLATLLAYGASASFVVILFRSFSSSLLHASSTAATGYGLAGRWLTGLSSAFLPYYLLAVLMHATFNFLASFGELYSDRWGETSYLFGFVATVAFAVIAVTVVRYKLASQRPAAAR